MNGLGEFFFELHADTDTGVIDMLAGPSEDALVRFPTRVVATPAGGSAFTFTMFQAPGQSSEQFEGQYASLPREFEISAGGSIAAWISDRNATSAPARSDPTERCGSGGPGNGPPLLLGLLDLLGLRPRRPGRGQADRFGRAWSGLPP